jgi:hypothetical protein
MQLSLSAHPAIVVPALHRDTGYSKSCCVFHRIGSAVTLVSFKVRVSGAHHDWQLNQLHPLCSGGSLDGVTLTVIDISQLSELCARGE